jgi:hypothetical protein
VQRLSARTYTDLVVGGISGRLALIQYDRLHFCKRPPQRMHCSLLAAAAVLLRNHLQVPLHHVGCLLPVLHLFFCNTAPRSERGPPRAR